MLPCNGFVFRCYCLFVPAVFVYAVFLWVLCTPVAVACVYYVRYFLLYFSRLNFFCTVYSDFVDIRDMSQKSVERLQHIFIVFVDASFVFYVNVFFLIYVCCFSDVTILPVSLLQFLMASFFFQVRLAPSPSKSSSCSCRMATCLGIWQLWVGGLMQSLWSAGEKSFQGNCWLLTLNFGLCQCCRLFSAPV